jgi:transposase
MEGRRYIEGADPAQHCFVPECLDEVIGENNPVRFIRVYVDSLDLKALSFTRAKPAATGRPAYDPGLLLKLYLYGYLNRIRSSRKLERESRRNLELWWLLSKLYPDHNTISDFRMENRQALKKVFKAFVRDCVLLGLADGQTVCIDGTPVRAVNSKDHATNIGLSQKKLAYAREQLALVERYMEELDAEDMREQGRLDKPFALDIDPKRLPDMNELKRRIALHEESLKIMEETGKTQWLFTDPEAAMMRTKDDSSHPCYNIQTATDAKNSLIVGFEATSRTDMGQLCRAGEMAKEFLGQEVLAVVADKGYVSGPDIEECLMNGVIPDVGFKYDREQRVMNLDYIPQEISEEQRASSRKEDIRACLHAGMLPDCYQNTNISVEVQHANDISCFIRHEDGRVTCPMGKELFFQSHRRYGDVYGSKEACRTCPNRCTDGKHFKTVQFGKDTRYVPVVMYGTRRYPLQAIPMIAQSTPYHAFGRVERKPSRVMIYIRRDVQKQKLRMQVSEHPFGTLKWYDGYHYFLCKGKEKVEAETALAYLSYDFRRAFTLLGVAKLIAFYQGKSLRKCKI